MFQYRRVGGLRFLKLGRITLTLAVSSKAGKRSRKSRAEIAQNNINRGWSKGYRVGIADALDDMTWQREAA